MIKTKKLLVILLCLVLALSASLLIACQPNNPDENPGGTDTDNTPTVGKISGIITDEEGEAIDATITYGDDGEVDTDEDGKYEIRNVTIEDGIELLIEATGFNSKTVTVNKNDFVDGSAVVNVSLEEATANISGQVVIQGSTIPVAGATVTVSGKTTTTDENGRFSFTNVSVPKSIEIRASKEGYDIGRITVSPRNIKNGAINNVTVPIIAPDLDELAGLKAHELNSVVLNKSTYSNSDLKNGAWGSSHNSTGKIDSHGEGLCINSDTKEVRDNLFAYLYGKLDVTQQNQIITVYARMFNGQNAESDGGPYYAKLYLKAFEMKQDGTYEYITIGGPATIDTESFKAISFDMSNYVGKTLVLILGTNTGYHCCLDRIEFAQVAPSYITVSGVDGIGSIMAVGKTNETSFDAEALKSNVWGKDGPTTKPDAGVQLNSGDPWKAVELNEDNPQPVNSSMYILTDVAANTTVKVHATIVNLNEVQDPGQGGKVFLPYIGLVVLNSDGQKLYQSDWKKVEVEQNNEDKVFEFDISEYAGEDRIVMIVCNVGYRPTITAVELATQSVTPPTEEGGDNQE